MILWVSSLHRFEDIDCHVNAQVTSTEKSDFRTFCRIKIEPPLWQRQIPEYPVYVKGNPQLRIFMPLFWMKMIKPQKKMPTDQVVFEVHPQMTNHDIKNYLEKIYNVPVLQVRTDLLKGNKRPSLSQRSEDTLPEKTIAYVQLDENFTFPDLFKKKTQETKLSETRKSTEKSDRKTKQDNWRHLDLAPWLR